MSPADISRISVPFGEADNKVDNARIIRLVVFGKVV